MYSYASHYTQYTKVCNHNPLSAHVSLSPLECTLKWSRRTLKARNLVKAVFSIWTACKIFPRNFCSFCLLTRQCQIENIVWKLDSTHSFSVFLNCEWIHLIMVVYESHKIPIHYFLVCVVATNCWRLAVRIDPSWKQLNQTFTPNAISKIYLAWRAIYIN